MSLFLDGEFALGLDRRVVDQLSLIVGRHLDQAALDDIVAAEEKSRATNTALNFLAVRPRSQGEIIRRLRQGGFPEATINHVMERLRDWRYVDDEDFARRWVDNRTTHRPRGTRMLAQELRAKGVDAEVASQAIEEADIDEFSGALSLGQKRAQQLADLEPDVRTRRLVAYLGRRGYPYEVIRRVIEAVESPEETEEWPES